MTSENTNNEPAAEEMTDAETPETTATDETAEPMRQPPELLLELASGLEQIDEKGELDNAAAIVRELKRHYPNAFRAERAAAVGIDGGAGAAADPLTREMLAKMKPADIAKLDWQAVRHVLENTK